MLVEENISRANYYMRELHVIEGFPQVKTQVVMCSHATIWDLHIFIACEAPAYF